MRMESKITENMVYAVMMYLFSVKLVKEVNGRNTAQDRDSRDII